MKFTVSYDSDIESAPKVASVINEYFERMGFRLLEQRHTTYPIDEKKTKYAVGDAYKTLNFTRYGENITILLIREKIFI